MATSIVRIELLRSDAALQKIPILVGVNIFRN